ALRRPADERGSAVLAGARGRAGGGPVPRPGERPAFAGPLRPDEPAGDFAAALGAGRPRPGRAHGWPDDLAGGDGLEPGVSAAGGAGLRDDRRLGLAASPRRSEAAGAGPAV